MNNYNEQDYLAHYGVLGMKWGVRHDPQRAYERASKKLNRLSRKSDRAYDKMTRQRKKSERAAAVGMGNRSRGDHARKAGNYKRRAMRYAKRGSKWLKAMEREFANQDVVSIDSKLQAQGAVLAERERYLKLV